MNSAVRPFRARRRRLLAGVVAVGFLAGATAFAWPVAALEPGSPGATATQDGWWNRFQGPQEGEPENPLRPAVPAAPAPPNIPADTIVAGAAFGQPTWIAAVGIELALPEGDSLEALTLRLKESPAPLANMNAETAEVVACPAVIPWGPAKNAAWRDRPEADCTLGQAAGTRAEDGTWTFDLTAIGALWADPFAPLAENGVVLALDPASSPGVAQVAWLDFDSGNIIVELVTTPGAGLGVATPEAPPSGPAPAGASAPDAAGAESAAGDPVLDAPGEPPAAGDLPPLSDPFAFATGEGPFFPPVPIDVPVSAGQGAATGTGGDAAGTGAPGRAPAPRPAAGRSQPVAIGFWEGVPAPAVLLLPVALGLAILVGLVLGPGGRPSPVWGRAGGLTRALARRGDGEANV